MTRNNTILQYSKRQGSSNCKQVKVSIDPGVASAFKKSCISSNVSMASVIGQFMAQCSGISMNTQTLPVRNGIHLRTTLQDVSAVQLCTSS